MNCLKCKKELPAGAKYCIYCGVDAKTGRRQRSVIGRIWTWSVRLAGIFIGFFILISIALAALPGLFQIYQIYHNPEATKQGLNESTNIHFSYVLKSPTPEKTGELNLTVLVKNGNERDIPITRAKLFCTQDIQVLSGDQGFKGEADSYGEKVLSYDPPINFKARDTTTYNLVLKTTAQEIFACQLIYLNLLQNITTGFGFTVSTAEMLK